MYVDTESRVLWLQSLCSSLHPPSGAACIHHARPVDHSPPPSPLPHRACSIALMWMRQWPRALHPHPSKSWDIHKKRKKAIYFPLLSFSFSFNYWYHNRIFFYCLSLQMYSISSTLWAKEAFVDYPKNPIIIYNRQDFFGNGFWILTSDSQMRV